MASQPHLHLSRRERQIMEILYRHGQASAANVLKTMHDPPSYSAVRTTLRLLEDKGHVRHKQVGKKYVYQPTVTASRARRSALRNLLNTFFDGSVEHAVASLLDVKARNLSEAELNRLSELIEKAKRGETKP